MRVKPCFLVNVRKASGRRVAGGRRTGRTVAGRIGGAVVIVVVGGFADPVRRWFLGLLLSLLLLLLLMGWRGVPKAGEEEGMAVLASSVRIFVVIVCSIES